MAAQASRWVVGRVQVDNCEPFGSNPTISTEWYAVWVMESTAAYEARAISRPEGEMVAEPTRPSTWMEPSDSKLSPSYADLITLPFLGESESKDGIVTGFQVSQRRDDRHIGAHADCDLSAWRDAKTAMSSSDSAAEPSLFRPCGLLAPSERDDSLKRCCGAAERLRIGETMMVVLRTLSCRGCAITGRRGCARCS